MKLSEIPDFLLTIEHEYKTDHWCSLRRGLQILEKYPNGGSIKTEDDEVSVGPFPNDNVDYNQADIFQLYCLGFDLSDTNCFFYFNW